VPVKLIIDGREYQAVNHKGAQLLHLMELRQQSRAFTEDGKGLGMRAIEELVRVADLPGAEGDPDAQVLGFAVLLFLTRRAAGDKVTFEQAAAVAFNDVEVLVEASDLPEVPQDPTAPGGTGTPAAPGDLGVSAETTNTPSTM
jgi:hypothetical protein